MCFETKLVETASKMGVIGNTVAAPAATPMIPKLGFKVGDRVTVVRKGVSYANGWKNSWVSQMDPAIGQTGVVTGVLEHNQDITVKVSGVTGSYGYPPFSLELVKETPVVPQPETRDGFTVGQVVTIRTGRTGVVKGFDGPFVLVLKGDDLTTTSWYPSSLSGPVTVTEVPVSPAVVPFKSAPLPVQCVNVARDLAVKLARQNPAKTVTIDWVQDELVRLGFKSTDLGNAAGVIFKSKQFRNTGTTAKSVRPGNNHRRITVWEYVGEPSSSPVPLTIPGERFIVEVKPDTEWTRSKNSPNTFSTLEEANKAASSNHWKNGLPYRAVKVVEKPVTERYIVEAQFASGWERSSNGARTVPGNLSLATYVFPNRESADKEAFAQSKDQGRDYRAVPLA